MSLSLVNLSCPYLRAVWLRKQAGGFSCRSVLGILLLRLQVAIFELEMRESTFRTLLSRLKTEVAMFELELRARASPLHVGTYDFAAGAAAGMHFAYNFGRSHGNALRPLLLPLESCNFAAGAAGMHFARHFCA